MAHCPARPRLSGGSKKNIRTVFLNSPFPLLYQPADEVVHPQAVGGNSSLCGMRVAKSERWAHNSFFPTPPALPRHIRRRFILHPKSGQSTAKPSADVGREASHRHQRPFRPPQPGLTKRRKAVRNERQTHTALRDLCCNLTPLFVYDDPFVGRPAVHAMKLGDGLHSNAAPQSPTYDHDPAVVKPGPTTRVTERHPPRALTAALKTSARILTSSNKDRSRFVLRLVAPSPLPCAAGEKREYKDLRSQAKVRHVPRGLRRVLAWPTRG